MSVFTAEDVADMAATGNAAFNSVWLARFKDSTAPNGSDVTKLREFIKSKYVDRKWFDDRSGNGKMNGNGASSNSNSYDRDRNSQERSAEHSAGSDPGDLWGKKQSSTSRSTPLPKVILILILILIPVLHFLRARKLLVFCLIMMSEFCTFQVFCRTLQNSETAICQSHCSTYALSSPVITYNSNSLSLS